MSCQSALPPVEGRHRQLRKGRLVFDDHIDIVYMQETGAVGPGHIGIDLYNYLAGSAAYFQIVVYRYPKAEAAVAIHGRNRCNSCIDLAFFNKNPRSLMEQVGCIGGPAGLICFPVCTAEKIRFPIDLRRQVGAQYSLQCIDERQHGMHGDIPQPSCPNRIGNSRQQCWGLTGTQGLNDGGIALYSRYCFFRCR